MVPNVDAHMITGLKPGVNESTLKDYRCIRDGAVRLFVAQTLDGIEARGFARRPDTKDYAYAN